MKKKKHKAMFTLEATIVVPIILIAIFAVLYAFQILYQNAVLEYAVSYGSSRGAMMWDYDINGRNFTEGTVNGKNELYYDLFGNKEANRKDIEDRTKDIVKSLTFIGGDVDVEVKYKSSLIGSSIEVFAEQRINVPFENIVTYFQGLISEKDGKKGVTISAKSSASLYDPDEFIRNTDYAYESIKPLFSKLKGKLNGFMGNVVNKIMKK